MSEVKRGGSLPPADETRSSPYPRDRRIKRLERIVEAIGRESSGGDGVELGEFKGLYVLGVFDAKHGGHGAAAIFNLRSPGLHPVAIAAALRSQADDIETDALGPVDHRDPRGYV